MQIKWNDSGRRGPSTSCRKAIDFCANTLFCRIGSPMHGLPVHNNHCSRMRALGSSFMQNVIFLREGSRSYQTVATPFRKCWYFCYPCPFHFTLYVSTGHSALGIRRNVIALQPYYRNAGKAIGICALINAQTLNLIYISERHFSLPKTCPQLGVKFRRSGKSRKLENKQR